MVKTIKRLGDTYHISNGVENLRKKLGYKTLGPLRSKRLTKTRRCTPKKEGCFRITLTKKGMKKLRKK